MATGFFAVATVFNMSMLNDNGAGDVSLDAVAVMAQAGGEASFGLFCAHVTNNTCRYIDGYEQEGTFQHQP